MLQMFSFNLFFCHFCNTSLLFGLTEAGQINTSSVKCLVNSISRFMHLVCCQAVKPMPLQKNCNNMVGVLKRLKPVLDDIVDFKIPLDENLHRECEELDMQVNEAREFIEKLGPKMSRIHSVITYILNFLYLNYYHYSATVISTCLRC